MKYAKQVMVYRNNDDSFHVEVTDCPTVTEWVENDAKVKLVDEINDLPCERSADLLAQYFCVKHGLTGYTSQTHKL